MANSKRAGHRWPRGRPRPNRQSPAGEPRHRCPKPGPGATETFAAAIADLARGLLARHFPGVEFLQWPGGLVAGVFSDGYYASIAVEIQGDQLPVLESQGKAIAAVAPEAAQATLDATLGNINSPGGWIDPFQCVP
jgi:hypothetical protein